MTEDDPLRVGICGLIHDHVWDHLPQLTASDGAQLVAVAESHRELRQRIRRHSDCPLFETPSEMFDNADLDAVFVFSSNREGAEIVTEAARRGVHAVIEKPMAASLGAADNMLVAAREHGTRVMLNWPFCWWPQMQAALRMATDGEIGEVWQVKYRAAHAGPRELGCSEFFCDWLFNVEANGGGALMDYCCYGAALARVVLGVPHRVTAVAGRLCKENIAVEDNAICVMQYPRAMATAEGSWTQVGKLTSYTTAIYGNRGTLLVEPRAGGRLLLATDEHPQGTEVALSTPPLELQNATEHFLYGLRRNVPFMPLCQDRVGRDTQEILEAGIRSAATHQAVALPLGAAIR